MCRPRRRDENGSWRDPHARVWRQPSVAATAGAFLAQHLHNISVNIAGNDEASSSSNISGKKGAGSELEEVKETVRDLSTKVATLLEAQGKLLEALAKK